MGKQFNIKDAETVRLARELADQLGGSVTAAIRDAVREKLDIVLKNQAKPSVEEEMASLKKIRGHWKSDFDGQQLSVTHGDLLYDENGLPG